MKVNAAPPITFSLSVQYGSRAAHLPARAQVRRWVASAWRAAAPTLPQPSKALVATIRYVDETEGRALNREFRAKDYATNVLTFVSAPPVAHAALVADIAICAPIVAREAKAQRKPVHVHHAHMVIHGVLHALGFDHEHANDAALMENLEIQVLSRFRINNPYE